MKYIVEVTSSNPSHEHVSLRKVQKKTSFVVEAASEAEALNRARGKFRSLGHYVHNATIAEMARRPATPERPVPNPNAVPKTPPPGEEPPAVPGHSLEAERAKIEAEVEKRRLELEKQAAEAAAKKAAEKAAAPKNEETEISEKITLGAPVAPQVAAKEKTSKDMEDKEDTALARINRSAENTRETDPEYSKRVAAFKDAWLKKKKAADAGETELNIKEGFDTDPKDIAAYLIDRHGKGKVTMDHIEAYERRRDSHRPIEKHEVMKFVKKMSEEVDQIYVSEKLDRSNTSYTVQVAGPVSPAAVIKRGINDIKGAVGSVGKAIGRLKKQPANAADELQPVEIKSQKRNMGEETQYIEEKLTGADPASKWISDFVASDNPKFAGKSKKERINMALGAYYSAKRSMKEEVEQIMEGDLSIRTLYNKWADHYTSDRGNSAKRADAVEKAIIRVHGSAVMNHLKKAIKANLRGDMDQEENHFERARTASEKSGSDRVGATVGRGRSKFRKEEVEQVDEGFSHFLYTGEVNGKEYELTIPRNRDLGDYSDESLHRKLRKENPHLEHHEVTAIVDSGGEEESKVDVEHKGEKYTHHVINHQEPGQLYNEEVEQVDEAQKKLKPSYWRAEWRMGTKSEVDKNNKKIYDRLAKTDPAKAKAFHDNLMKMRKEEVAPVNEIVRIVGKIVGATIKKGADDVVKAKPTVAVGTEKTAAKAAEIAKADATYQATGGAKVGGWKNLSPDELKAAYERARAARQRAATKPTPEPKSSGSGPETPPPAAPGARVVPLKKPAHAVSVKASQNPYMAVANEAAETTTTKTTIDDKMGKPLPPRKPSSDTDPGLEKKKTAAAEKMINAARGKVNRVNTKPTMDVNLKDKK